MVSHLVVTIALERVHGLTELGNMGKCILDGIANATFGQQKGEEASQPTVAKVIACTSTNASAQRLRSTYANVGEWLVVSSGSNVEAMRQASIIVLGCKPHMVQDVLQEGGVREALENKLVVSILAGTPVSLLRQYICGGSASSEECINKTHIVRAIPNLGAQCKASMTLIEQLNATIPDRFEKIVRWLFDQIGRSKYFPESQFDTATAVVTSSIAMTSVLLEGMLDGAVAEGLKRSDALELAAQGLEATARLLLNDPSFRPSTILERMASLRGVTIQAILKAEEGNIRRVAAETVIHGTQHLQRMSKPAQR